MLVQRTPHSTKHCAAIDRTEIISLTGKRNAVDVTSRNDVSSLSDDALRFYL